MLRDVLPTRPSAPSTFAGLRRRLLLWYRSHARALPWRGTRDPYRIWVSEAMLQQTRVATAHSYYKAFLARFPTLASLARARAEEVLAAWSGLGYYRRARHLHQAARLVARDHAGRVPSDPETFGGLPGVGRYTTGAVLSLAFDRPLPVVDGNVARVLSRVFALRASVRDPRGARRLWALAEALVPMRAPGEWNQALMELGAMVCVPRGPRCEICPVAALCRARALGRVGAFPPRETRRTGVPVNRAVALIVRRGRLLMARREGALLEGLWEPPGVEVANGASARARLLAELARLGVRARLAPTGRSVRHTITHRAITVSLWRGEGVGRVTPSARLRWVDPSRARLPLTALARRLAAEA
ncbi:MAG TPA: A/G-specific adenine glycosylase [Candidatus Eisenbacteria bacterium]|jgi:A/G-specific adenine glycosylase